MIHEVYEYVYWYILDIAGVCGAVLVGTWWEESDT